MYKIGTSRRRRQRHLVNGIEASQWARNESNTHDHEVGLAMSDEYIIIQITLINDFIGY